MALHHLPLSSLHSNALSFCLARCCHEQSNLKFSHSSSQQDCLWHCKRIHIHYIIRRNHSSPLREIKEPKPPSELQRLGIGQALAILAMIISGIVEQQRLKHAGNFGNIEMEFFEYFLADSTIHIYIFFANTQQYILLGVSEAFVYVAQMAFFASQTPDELKSLGMRVCKCLHR